jgi:hypothetical protein
MEDIIGAGMLGLPRPRFQSPWTIYNEDCWDRYEMAAPAQAEDKLQDEMVRQTPRLKKRPLVRVTAKQLENFVLVGPIRFPIQVQPLCRPHGHLQCSSEAPNACPLRTHCMPTACPLHARCASNARPIRAHHAPTTRSLRAHCASNVRRLCSSHCVLRTQADAKTFDEARRALAAAPYGYEHDDILMRDWRSWQAWHHKRWSLASILLQQRLPEKLPEGLRNYFERLQKEHPNIAVPQLPACTLKLLPVRSVDAPCPPPDGVLRVCLYMDCTSTRRPHLIGVITNDSTYTDVQREVARVMELPFCDKRRVRRRLVSTSLQLLAPGHRLRPVPPAALPRARPACFARPACCAGPAG